MILFTIVGQKGGADWGQGKTINFFKQLEKRCIRISFSSLLAFCSVCFSSLTEEAQVDTQGGTCGSRMF